VRKYGSILTFGVFLAASPVYAQDDRMSVWAGAYTSAQADRGAKSYTTHCADCHQTDLRGKGEIPALKGESFMERWRDYSIQPLFNLVKTEMPPIRFRTPETKPLSDETYVDIITYLLRENAFPAGDEELTAGTVDDVQIVGKGGAQPPPQFALVLSVGCMRFKPAGWALSYATTPIRATMPDVAAPDEVEAAKAARLGVREYRLASFGYLGRDFNPEALEDHRILVKGYIIRQPEFERISVTSVTTISPDCE
jgi:hypothetical protein